MMYAEKALALMRMIIAPYDEKENRRGYLRTAHADVASFYRITAMVFHTRPVCVDWCQRRWR